MIEELKSKIKGKKEELDMLNKQLQRERKTEFNFMVGKYYQSAATCLIKVERIDSVDYDSVYVEGVVAYVGNKNLNSFQVDFRGSENIRISNIANSEITRETFLEVMMLEIAQLQDNLKAVCS